VSTRTRLNAALDRMEFVDRDDVIFFSGFPGGKSPEQAAKDRARDKAQAEAATKARAKAAAERKKKSDKAEEKGKNDEPTEVDEDGVSNRTKELEKKLEERQKIGNKKTGDISTLKKALEESKRKDKDSRENRLRKIRQDLWKNRTSWTGWGTLNVPKVGTVYVNTPVLPYGTSFT
jgi:hypothetical protein